MKESFKLSKDCTEKSQHARKGPYPPFFPLATPFSVDSYLGF